MGGYSPLELTRGSAKSSGGDDERPDGAWIHAKNRSLKGKDVAFGTGQNLEINL